VFSQPAVSSSFFDPILRWLLSPVGIGVLAALDSTIVFFLPLGLDLALVIMGAMHPDLFWLYALIATAGSVVGAYTSFQIGVLAGEAGLTHLVPERKLQDIKRRVSATGAVTLAVLDLLPPPFPFTLFLVVAGALDVNRTRFFVTLAVVRFLRFALESGLGALYGARFATQVGSRVLADVAGVLVLAAAIFTCYSIIKLVRRARPRRV
jgi:membrane protein YqaA with SNARE-associated domain